MKEILETFINEIKTIPGFISVSITEIISGVAYKSYTANKNFDLNIVAPYNLEVVKAKLKAIETLNLTEGIEDIAITSSNQMHIINVAPNRAYFIYLAVSSKDANVAITKSLLSKHKKALYAVI